MAGTGWCIWGGARRLPGSGADAAHTLLGKGFVPSRPRRDGRSLGDDPPSLFGSLSGWVWLPLGPGSVGESLLQFCHPSFRSEFRQQLKPFWVFPSSASEEFSDLVSQTPFAWAAAHEH